MKNVYTYSEIERVPVNGSIVVPSVLQKKKVAFFPSKFQPFLIMSENYCYLFANIARKLCHFRKKNLKNSIPTTKVAATTTNTNLPGK